MFIENTFELETTVISSININNQYHINLENTIFYPTSGGQLCDIGTINNVEVIDVYKKDGKIYHVTNENISGNVYLKIDKEVRYKHSLFHSAQHLLSIVFDMDNAFSSSFNMSSDHFIIDVAKTYTRDELNQFEKQINSYILKSVPIIKREYDKSIDHNLDISNITDDKITVVEVKDLEVCLCGGTHLSNTSEIKFIKIVKFKLNGNKTRLTVYAGDYAYDYINKYFDNYNNLINDLKHPENEVSDLIIRKFKELKKLQKQLKNK